MARITHASAVRTAIENEIFSGKLAPGEALDEEALAARFSVSRTPVREAMLQLIQTGLISKESRRSATVAKLDLHRLIHLFETISELEGLCARFAARRITNAEKSELVEAHAQAEIALERGTENEYRRLGRHFHALIIKATHNSVLADATNKLALHSLPYRHFQLRRDGRPQANHQDHDKILKAIVEGNEQEAWNAMRHHVTVQGDVLADYIATDSSL